jgi:hypothetical protein
MDPEADPVARSQLISRLLAELWFQPIAYRWAINLKPYNGMEPQRSIGFYEATAVGPGVMLVRARTAAN